MECRNHPGIAAIERCDGCGQPFCYECLVEMGGWKYCAACRGPATQGRAPLPMALGRPALTCDEAVWALVLSLLGVFTCCFAIILEPIALVLAGKAKKKIEAQPHLSGSGMATAAQVIAVLMLIFWLLYLLAIFTSAM